MYQLLQMGKVSKASIVLIETVLNNINQGKIFFSIFKMSILNKNPTLANTVKTRSHIEID